MFLHLEKRAYHVQLTGSQWDSNLIIRKHQARVGPLSQCRFSSISKLEVASKCCSVIQGRHLENCPRDALGRGGKFYVCPVERKGNGFALSEGCCHRKSGLPIPRTASRSKVQPTVSGFGWELRGVAAGVGIPNCFWKHPEVTISGTIGDAVNWGPAMHFFILFLL